MGMNMRWIKQGQRSVVLCSWRNVAAVAGRRVAAMSTYICTS